MELIKTFQLPELFLLTIVVMPDLCYLVGITGCAVVIKDP